MDIFVDDQLCNNMAGHRDCAEDILKTHLGQPNGCPGGCTTCLSRYRGHPEACIDRAKSFMQDVAHAMRYIAHSKKKRQQHAHA